MPLLKSVLILICLDIVLLSAFVWWVDATPDVSIAELLIVPVIFIVNIVVAIISRFLIKNTEYSIAFVINAIVASIIFHFLFQAWFIYWDYSNFSKYKFKKNGIHYELVLDKRDSSYSLTQPGEGSTIEFKRGKYKVQNDTTLLNR